MSHPQLAELLDLARHYGADPGFSQAGGGHLSVKVDGVLYLNPTDVPMATLSVADLVPLDQARLLAGLAEATIDGDDVTMVSPIAPLAHLVSATDRRLCVEVLVHALIDQAFMVQTHPLVAHALACNHADAELVTRLLGADAVLVPYAGPGVELAQLIQVAAAEYTARTSQVTPAVWVLAGHGIMVSGDSAQEVMVRTAQVTAVIAEAIDAVQPPPVPPLGQAQHIVMTLAPTLRALLGTDEALAVVRVSCADLARAVTAASAGQQLAEVGPLTPEQIVYAGSFPVVIAPDEDPAAAIDHYRARYGCDPRVAVVPGVGVFGVGADSASADLALATYLDALRVARDADRIGTVRPMSSARRVVVESWAADYYRKAPAVPPVSGRLAGKVAVITGAAQGFGLGIARELISAGAHVVLADLNIDLARAEAAELCTQYGARRAVAVAVDVSNEESCLQMAADVVTECGGCDIFISNAGVLRADGVMSQPVADFDLVTQVNYRGYFLGVRAIAPIMAAQHTARPQVWFDIIEINSKSGLTGSKRNFAYAGSKFGGIGLTQSFALELVENGIKVNAVCPGNYLDGPLWMDPERGLFVQYLRAGKVPGAQTISDVRAYYEAQVPMRRGCFPLDLARAIYYIVEQQYETGQAVPVTGGQIMLG